MFNALIKETDPNHVARIAIVCSAQQITGNTYRSLENDVTIFHYKTINKIEIFSTTERFIKIAKTQ